MNLTFKCPGCGDMHVVLGDRWTVTGTSPADVTCSPSLLATSGHYCPGRAEDNGCWCGQDLGFTCYRCHSFIRSGRIEFLGDCSHALAGKTVPIPADATLINPLRP